MANSFDTTSISGLLKQNYIGPVIDAFAEEVVMLRVAEKSKGEYVGSVAKVPVRLGRNQGVGATTELGVLPKLGNVKTVQASLNARYLYGRIGLSAQILSASRNDKGAFLRDFGFQVEMTQKDISADANRAMNYDGSAKIGEIAANAVASQTLSVTGRTSTEPALKYLWDGMEVDVVNSSGTVVGSGEITSVSGTPFALSATIVLDGAVTCTAGDIITRKGSYNNEFQGVLTALDGLTTSVYGIDRSQYIQFQSNVIDGAGAQFNRNAMTQAYLSAKQRGGMVNSKFEGIHTDFTTIQYYEKLLVPDLRFISKVNGVDGGFGSPDELYFEHNGIGMYPDKDSITHCVWVPKGGLKFLVQEELHVVDEAGYDMFPVADVDAWEIRLRMFANLINVNPAGFARYYNYISP